MAGRGYGRLRRSVSAVAGLVCVVAVLTGSPETGKALGRPYRVLQMNLCDSGIADCYTGRSVAEAAAVIRATAPDLVTLNEVCAEDVHALDRALTDVYPGGVVSAFKAAINRRTGGAVRCRNGQPYGIGLLVHSSATDQAHTTYDGVYPAQDIRDPEERVWLCLSVTGIYACTTHLASTSSTIALAQCGYLFGTAIPSVHREGGYQPTVLGGDLNLRSCAPSEYRSEDDGGVQQVVATTEFRATSSRSIDMNRTTDHPGLLVALTIAQDSR